MKTCDTCRHLEIITTRHDYGSTTAPEETIDCTNKRDGQTEDADGNCDGWEEIGSDHD